MYLFIFFCCPTKFIIIGLKKKIIIINKMAMSNISQTLLVITLTCVLMEQNYIQNNEEKQWTLLTHSSFWMNLCSCLRRYRQPRKRSRGHGSSGLLGPDPPPLGGKGAGVQSKSKASWVSKVGMAPAHDLCGSTLDRWVLGPIDMSVIIIIIILTLIVGY
jgi:hypothetical protein